MKPRTLSQIKIKPTKKVLKVHLDVADIIIQAGKRFKVAWKLTKRLHAFVFPTRKGLARGIRRYDLMRRKQLGYLFYK